MPRGQRQTRQPQVEGKLSNSLVLNRYILSLFGATSLEALSEHLKDPILEGWDENNVSYFYRELLSRMFATGELTEEMLLAYDENIYRHTQAISEKREAQVRWKYFQYLSLLFTEIYLDKYFSDRKKLLADINTYLRLSFNADPKTYHGMTDFTEADLNKVAFWSATGSGKTLLMHVNVLQYRHYAEKYRQKPNRIILITPNEGLTNQHLEEFRKSNIGAGVFNKNTASGLFAGHDVDILEITKLGPTETRRWLWAFLRVTTWCWWMKGIAGRAVRHGSKDAINYVRQDSRLSIARLSVNRYPQSAMQQNARICSTNTARLRFLTTAIAISIMMAMARITRF